MAVTVDDLSTFHAEMVLHCQLCLSEMPEDASPKDWARLAFGCYHKPGEAGIYLQLWCLRHDCNVSTIHIETEHWSHTDIIPLRIKGASDHIPA